MLVSSVSETSSGVHIRMFANFKRIKLSICWNNIKFCFTKRVFVFFLHLNSSYVINKCNFFFQIIISYTARKWLQSALQHTDTWMDHIFPPPSKTRMRDSRSFKLDSNRRRSSIRGGFLWYHLHRQQKNFLPRLDGYRDRSYLPLRFFFVSSPVPFTQPVWAITQWWIVTTKVPWLYEVTFVKARLLRILMDSFLRPYLMYQAQMSPNP